MVWSRVYAAEAGGSTPRAEAGGRRRRGRDKSPPSRRVAFESAHSPGALDWMDARPAAWQPRHGVEVSRPRRWPRARGGPGSGIRVGLQFEAGQTGWGTPRAHRPEAWRPGPGACHEERGFIFEPIGPVRVPSAPRPGSGSALLVKQGRGVALAHNRRSDSDGATRTAQADQRACPGPVADGRSRLPPTAAPSWADSASTVRPGRRIVPVCHTSRDSERLLSLAIY